MLSTMYPCEHALIDFSINEAEEMPNSFEKGPLMESIIVNADRKTWRRRAYQAKSLFQAKAEENKKCDKTTAPFDCQVFFSAVDV